MQNVMIVGAGKGGTAILKILKESEVLKVSVVIDRNLDAPGILFAQEEGIKTGEDWRSFLAGSIDIIIEVTGNDTVFQELRKAKSQNTILIPGSVAFLVAKIMQEKEELIEKHKNESYQQELIFNAANDGMIVIDKYGKVILFNKRAQEIMGVKSVQAIGKFVVDVVPTTRLPQILETRRIEANQEMVLSNDRKIITTRIPIIEENGTLIGAFAVFKDITEVVNLAEELTDLKEIQTMLQAIIHSSDDAISVVDENGRGILINPAYSRITGLTHDQIIGQPATADISEGESMHMKVLQTRRAVRGVPMRVGPNKREVIVNVAPIIVKGKLKGSVGVIHDMSEIKSLNRELNRARQLIRKLEAKYTFEDIIAQSDEMMLAIEQAKLGAKTPATVLLRGESGTGKELFAHAIHNASDRKYNKFIRVNCAAISETLLESELFGYEEGAFSGAMRGGKRGFFEEANNGSIFLDEIGELPVNTQAKLLRVLQEKEIIRVGGTKPISINVRIIAATNVNLEKGIAKSSFREDLYYRLNRMPIHIPPLRKRKEEIPLLNERLIQKISQDYGRNVEGITPAALHQLMDYDWPGNVRELENILGRAIIFMNYYELLIDVHHLPELKNKKSTNEPSLSYSNDSFVIDRSLSDMMDEYETKIIKQTLLRLNGNKTLTAKTLGLSVRNLYYKLEKCNIEKNSMQ
ncbi:sigma-54-dependent transcriptional regulator [Bacillus sp. ISL-40]|uniref:sigma-54 interaction domain-containing protein n=1 Tax=unclassified Bacillus (in: firmicutes) TaxID=185979 RepID=UPI001BE74F10|nr:MULTISPECIES: sigma-54-dependent Fis family transcriptional regulator [unclassified Bacillus (in: firmicutes)]MBT2698666.1 sigma-54-dependent transcriptional regulator [Bacillus sp. ISL-40]MBT2724810.1 sigma-54-dependent transcriptional regulator [Bacillus sp. ISL-46]MBT2743509.1 sigma-54-dependent transcriptional regulator [Bacillus sp. ISL-77]